MKKRYWLLLPLFVVAISATLNYSGFCWDQKRWLSNEEKIDIALQGVTKPKTAYLKRGVGGARNYSSLIL